jgi:hypothetical protein
MTVKELVEKLGRFDENKEILCYCEDEDIGSRVFEISSVDLTKATTMRTEKGMPALRFEKSGIEMVIIEVTSDV